MGRRGFVHILLQKRGHAIVQGDGFVECRVRAGGVGTNLHQVAAALVFGIHRPKPACQLKVLARDHVVHHPRGRLFHVDGRIVARLGQRAREHDVPVQNRPGRIGNRVLLVVTFGQHGVERRDRAHAVEPIATALNQLRQLGKARRRIALGGGRLANGERNFTLRHGVAGERVHQQQHVLALVAKALGNRRGVRRALHTQQRRRVGRSGHHHRAGAAFFAQNIFDKFFDFAATLTDQPDHNHIGLGVARHHAQQHALAHARSGKQPDALTASHRQQGVDRTHSGVERLAHGCAVHGVDRTPVQRQRTHIQNRPLAVHRLALRIHHPAEQTIAQGQAQHAGIRWCGGAGVLANARHRNVGGRGCHTGTGAQAMDIARRHQKSAVAGKPDHLGQHRLARLHGNHALRAHWHPDATGFQHQSGQARERATHFERALLRHAAPRLLQVVVPLGGVLSLHHPPPTTIPAPDWQRRAPSAFPVCRPPPYRPTRPGSHHG